MLKRFLKLVFVFSFVLSFSFNLFAEESFTINFDNVDIKIFLKFMSKQLNRNFVPDDNVKGRISIICPQEIPVSEAERVFLTVLNVYGYTAIPRGNITAIIPVSAVKEKDLPVIVGKESVNLEELGERYVVQLIPLTYCNAKDLITLLSPFVGKTGNLSADERTNTLIITEQAAKISQLVRMITSLDKESPPGQEDLHVYKLQNADSEEIAKVLTAIASQRAIQQRIITSRTKLAETIVPSAIVADKSSNSLIITGSAGEYSALQKIIEKLDVIQNQVLIEALVAEVSEDVTRELGIEWESDLLREQLFGLALGSVKGKELSLSIGDIIHFYGKDSNFKILSTPQILVVDNQEASITIGETIPYLKESRITEADTIVKSYDYKDVGILLKILPRISEDKYVKLKIRQEVTKLVPGLSTEAPTTAKRAAESTVIVHDKHTVVMGGLLRNDKTVTIHKIPFLGDIPLFGYLFRRKSYVTQKTNLVIFITPHIITNPKKSDELRREKEKKLENKTTN
ncbi:MAG: hypothetical protein CO162_08055 [bacterium (Candidatus Ratteibacteria) CG_4_9_14_3_um_filter_41_21]|uniref:NolW-like domain-containing protein n=2 Tax=Candidatus Ratteibacteria TaxID=2979319 RepID=A0A2M7YDQ0_9BACT|nr:MAG: hypothetical protein AUJ76_02455 [Candidatus Omnitrophica bacterium CG1_02_41_171]PIW33112.1 MAG: hypothetical protein COW28_04590 [bacterium (Candidatus Ratteibacteria) CG15_BIG_FIL_POST_REV_8_21_14_020_41_12]PIW74299.1 MAG: hypothetical protein CO004_01420 [bacterium (Candidatus Ratteibacteria) CG_4_8_14_3_um_filter_41_36]PJA61105.1 MAG: hypothetical protein CO162_08055 [bacterium (Candidatus Ratteibacteria) CG_4_9_14_3_um_filter_41_21]HCG77254.1 hypothetical protein [bacterium]